MHNSYKDEFNFNMSPSQQEEFVRLGERRRALSTTPSTTPITEEELQDENAQSE